MSKFRKTKERSLKLLDWAIEDFKELNQLYRDLVTYIDNENMSVVLNSRIDLVRDSLNFYKENIVIHHLSFEQYKDYESIFPSKEDLSINYMM